MAKSIQSFWSDKKHVALFGFSRNPASVSRQVYNIMTGKGYQIYPINPHTNHIAGLKCYTNLNEIEQKLDAAIIITNPKITAEIIKQCHQRGLNELWFQFDTMDDEVKNYLAKNSMSYLYACILQYSHLINAVENK